MKAVEHAKSSEMVHLRVLCSNISDVVKLEFNVLEILKRLVKKTAAQLF